MLVNKKAVKSFALSMPTTRSHKFNRVGADFYVTCEGAMKAFIRGYLKSLPSKGKTIN